MGLRLEILIFSHEGPEATYTVVEDNRWPHNTLMWRLEFLPFVLLCVNSFSHLSKFCSWDVWCVIWYLKTMAGSYSHYCVELRTLQENVKKTDRENLCILSFTYYLLCFQDLEQVSDGASSLRLFCVSCPRSAWQHTKYKDKSLFQTHLVSSHIVFCGEHKRNVPLFGCVPCRDVPSWVDGTSEDPPGPWLGPVLTPVTLLPFAPLLGLAGTVASRPTGTTKHCDVPSKHTSLWKISLTLNALDSNYGNFVLRVQKPSY